MDSTNNFKDIDVFTFDQTLAEYGDADELCPPGKNRRLREVAGIATAIHLALRRADFDSVDGPVPIIRLNPTSRNVQTRERVGEEPLRHTSVVGYCIACDRPSGYLTPFWLNCGTVIAQVDLCNDCAKYAMNHLEGQPQIGNLIT